MRDDSKAVLHAKCCFPHSAMVNAVRRDKSPDRSYDTWTASDAGRLELGGVQPRSKSVWSDGRGFGVGQLRAWSAEALTRSYLYRAVRMMIEVN
jgi:hypothetical protein